MQTKIFGNELIPSNAQTSRVPDGMGSVMADVDRAVLEDYKIQQKEAAETENQVSSVFAGAKRATWVTNTEN